MKTLEFNLQKRLLIVEVGEIEEIIDVQPDFNTALLQGKKFIAVKGNHKLICKGSELSEEILKSLIEPKRISSSEGEIFPDYKNKGWLYGKPNRIKSFISAIEAQGYYWGENPIDFDDGENDLGKRQKMRVDWERAESKTFNPEKSLIFEILL